MAKKKTGPWTWTAVGRFAAVAICGAAVLLLVISQAYVIHDRVAFIHPAWPPVVQWFMAIGFELAIVAVGLACVVTGFDEWLVYSEIALLVPSLAVAVDVVSPNALPSWVSVSAISAMPLQYAIVILAGHRLFTHYRRPAETPVAWPTVVMNSYNLDDEPRPHQGPPHGPGIAARREFVDENGDGEWPEFEPVEERVRQAILDSSVALHPFSPSYAAARRKQAAERKTGQPPKEPARPLQPQVVVKPGSAAGHLRDYLQQNGGRALVTSIVAETGVSRAQVYKLVARDPSLVVSRGVVSSTSSN